MCQKFSSILYTYIRQPYTCRLQAAHFGESPVEKHIHLSYLFSKNPSWVDQNDIVKQTQQ